MDVQDIKTQAGTIEGFFHTLRNYAAQMQKRSKQEIGRKFLCLYPRLWGTFYSLRSNLN